MNFWLSVDDEVLTPLLTKLEGLNDQDLITKILDDGLAIFLNRIRARFLREVDPEGTPWKKSAAGIKRRSGGFTYRNKRKYTGTGTLFETGTLFHSIQAFQTGDATSRGIKTDVPYAKYLQTGENQGPWVFLGFGAEDLTIFEKLIVKRLSEAVNG